MIVHIVESGRLNTVLRSLQRVPSLKRLQSGCHIQYRYPRVLFLAGKLAGPGRERFCGIPGQHCILQRGVGFCSDSQLVVVVGSAAATRLELSRARGGLNETSASGGVREPALLAYIIYRKKKEKKKEWRES